jgi:hypothetical protein
MDSLIALLTILRYNPSLKSIDISRPIPQHQHTNWMDDIAIHIAQMLEVSRPEDIEHFLPIFSIRKTMCYKNYTFKSSKSVILVSCGFARKCSTTKHSFFLISVGQLFISDHADLDSILLVIA